MFHHFACLCHQIEVTLSAADDWLRLFASKQVYVARNIAPKEPFGVLDTTLIGAEILSSSPARKPIDGGHKFSDDGSSFDLLSDNTEYELL